MFNQIGSLFLPPHSYRLSWVTAGAMFLLGVCSVVENVRFPLAAGPPLTYFVHNQHFYFLWKAHQRRRSPRHAAYKELWHGVISSGHSPSADVRKQSHSCRWNRTLCNSTRGDAPCPADFSSRGCLIYSNVTHFGLLTFLINGSKTRY